MTWGVFATNAQRIQDENSRLQAMRPVEGERSTIEDQDIELFGAPQLRTLPARPTKSVNQEWNNAFGKGRKKEDSKHLSALNAAA